MQISGKKRMRPKFLPSEVEFETLKFLFIPSFRNQTIIRNVQRQLQQIIREG